MMKVLPPTTSIAKSLADLTIACEPEFALPAHDPRWEDLTEGRGDKAVEMVERRLVRRRSRSPLHLAFVSHRGAGKTTELRRLEGRLDLLLALAQAVEAFMRRRGTPLPSQLLERVSNWFSEVVKTTQWGHDYSAQVAAGVSAEAGIPYFAKLTASITSLFKVESKHRQEVKSVLKKYPGELLAAVNGLLDAAAETLQTEEQELLVMLDNLDRYSPQVIDKLLIRGADRIRRLHCNLILTPPISLMYRPESEQIGEYFQCDVMYTVRLRRPDQPYDQFDGPGRALLLKALGRRMDLDLLMPDPAAQDRVVIASGGAIRDLLDLVAEASLVANGPPISIDDIEFVVKRKRVRMRDLVNANGFWPTLARVARDKQIFDDDSCLQVLFHRLVFKYNGDGWYDVHPLITEMPEFQAASRALASTGGSAAGPQFSP